MKKSVIISLIAALSLQSFGFAAVAQSRVNKSIENSQSERNQELDILQKRIKQTLSDIEQFEAELNAAKKNASGFYTAGVYIRNASLVALIGGAALLVSASRAKPNGNMDEMGIAILGFLAGGVGTLGTAAGQGLIWLTDDEIKLAKSELKDAKTKLNIYQGQLEQLRKK